MPHFNTKYLPYLAALFQAFQFAHAGSVYFGAPGWIIGACGGIVINLSVAIAGTRVSDIAIKRKPLAYVTLGLLLILSPIAVAPAAHISMTAVTSDVLRWLVAAVWASLPDLSILLTGAIAGKSLVQDGIIPQRPLSETPASLKRKKKSLSEFECRYAGAGCERKFASQNSANAHARSCGFKPTIAMPINVTVQKEGRDA